MQTFGHNDPLRVLRDALMRPAHVLRIVGTLNDAPKRVKDALSGVRN